MAEPGPTQSPGDPFPRERVTALIGRLPSYLRLAMGLAGDARLPKWRRAAVIAGAAYVASPIDLVPGLIPIVGQLDDILVALVTLRAALSGLDPQVRARHLGAAGLSDDDLAADLATLGATSAWLGRRGLEMGTAAARTGGQAAMAGGRAAVHSGRVLARRGREIAIWGRGAAGSLRRRRTGSP